MGDFRSAVEALTEAEKQHSKDDVDYRPGTGKKLCGACAHFQAGKCDIVKGKIRAKYTCDKWKAKKKSDK